MCFRATGINCAMKIVDKYKCQGKETMLLNEVDVLRQVDHPNIVKLIGLQDTLEQLFLVMELVPVSRVDLHIRGNST